MAKNLSKSGITTGNTVKAGHVTQSIDAFTGVEAYDLTLSGSLVITGSITGQPGVVNQLTASYALSASVEITHEVSSSYAQTASFAENLFGNPSIAVTNITASSNISASSTGSFAHIQLPGNGTIQFDNTPGSNDQYITGYDNNINIYADGQLFLNANMHTFTGGPITASKSISSSGDIIGVTGSLDHVKLGSSTFLELHSPDDVPSTTSPIIQIGTPITNLFTLDTLGDAVFGSSVSVSGGNVILQNSANNAFLNVKGSITASSNISASGTITGVTGSFSHLVGNSPITINDQTTFTLPITASGGFSGEVTNVYRPITTLSTNPFTASNATAGTYYRAGGNITCSIFSSSLVSCTLGSEFEIIQTSSAGYVLFETGSGVTLNSKSNKLKIAGQFSAITLKKVGDNEWDLIGDLG